MSTSFTVNGDIQDNKGYFFHIQNFENFQTFFASWPRYAMSRLSPSVDQLLSATFSKFRYEQKAKQQQSYFPKSL